MSSVFRKDDKHVEKPKRNVYDKTFATSLTTKFGQILPVFCKPVMNGESIKIKHKHTFNMLPFVFPVQTRVRASLQYFYVRTRNLYKDWEDFQFKMKPNLTLPYHKFTNKTKRTLLNVGGLLDNLGVPVVTYHNVPTGIGLDMPVGKVNFKVYNPYTSQYEDAGGKMLKLPQSAWRSLGAMRYMPWESTELSFSSTTGDVNAVNFVPYRYPIKPTSTGSVNVKYRTDETASGNERYYFVVRVSQYVKDAEYVSVERSGQRDTMAQRANNSAHTSSARRSIGQVESNKSTEQITRSESTGFEDSFIIIEAQPGNTTLIAPDGYVINELIGVLYPDNEKEYVDDYPAFVSVNPADYPEHGVHVSDIGLPWFPYANMYKDDETTMRISSLPMRAYESIYNSFIRNAENNPYKIDGVNEYNKFLENTDGGADTYDYKLRYRNWQDDAFTTALHTPQHGQAPLVGLVNNGGNNYVVTFANDDGTKNRVMFYSGGTVGTAPGSAVKVLKTADSGTTGLVESDAYVGQLEEAMIEAVNFGISINDFRNVNSFQRWLENNVRKGYKYRDQIKAHFGVSVRYDTLDMPEYLGGTSRDMYVNQVTQTTENENGVLGDYAGQGYINGESEHSINHYCDEEGFVIGLLSIMPSANYSQTIPKYLLRQDAFDFFSPEYGKIGMQPILNREIDALGSFYDGTADKVFGYQRPWYDYLDSLDTIHGKFRTEFRNFVLTRTFDQTPALTENFLVYDPDSVNNIFYVDDDEDKILGQILFEYKSRIPIPLYGIPALE